MGLRRGGIGRPLSVLLLLQALVGAACALSAPAAEALVTQANYRVRGSENLAETTCRLSVRVLQKGWQAVPLMSAAVPLESCAVRGGKGYVERSADRYRAHLRGEGEYAVELTYLLEVERDGARRSVGVPLVRATGACLEFELEGKGWSVESVPEVPIEVSTAGGVTSARLYPGDLDFLTLSWEPMPAEPERAPSLEAAEETLVVLQPGAAVRRSRVQVEVRRGEIDGLGVLLPSAVEVRKVEAGGGGLTLREWQVEDRAEGRRLKVSFEKPAAASFDLEIVSEELTPPAGEPVVLTPFHVEGAERQSGRLEVAADEAFRVVDAGSTAVRSTVSDKPLDPQAVVPTATKRLAYLYHRLPVELRLRLVPVAAQVAATTASFARLGPGVVDMDTRVSYVIGRRPVERFRLELDEGLIVLAVSGNDLDVWGVEAGVLEVRLRRPAEERYELGIQCVQHLRRVDGVLIPQVRCLDVESQSGSMGVSAGEDVALVHHHSRRFVQVDLDRLPQWVREQRPKLGYVYDQPGGEVAVSTSLVRPVFQVQGYAAASVAGDTVSEEYLYVIEVQRRPLFGFRLFIPEGLIPINLVGERVADWEFYPGQGLLGVSLAEGVTGRTTLHLFCERRLAQGQKAIPLGGAAVLDADHATGWFGVATQENLDLVAVGERGITAADVKDAPPLIAASPGLKLAYRWTGAEWGLECRTEAIEPRVEAETRTALLFGGGRVTARTDVALHVSKASLTEVLVRLPDGTVDSDVSGPNIQASELVAGLWQVRLAEPVVGDYTLRVTLEQLPGPDGVLRYTGVVLPQAYRQTGTVGVYLADPEIEVAVGQLDGATRADRFDGLGFEGCAFLGAFRYGQPEAAIEFRLTGHAMAGGVQLRGDRVQIATVVKREGQAVTFMNCRVRNAGQQFLRLTLPQGALLWGAYVQGRPVRPSELPGGRILVPLLEAPARGLFDVSLIWAEPSKRMRLGASLALQAPELDLPAEEVSWDLYLPTEYEVLQAGGNMEMLRRQPWHQQGLPGVLSGHLEALWRAVQPAWPVVRTLLIIAAGLLGLAAAIYAAARGLKALARAARRGREAGVKKRPSLVGRLASVIVILVIIALLASMMMPSLSRSRQEARGAASKANLHDLGLGFTLYRQDHDGKLPPSLKAMFPQYVESERAFESPTGERYLYAGPLEPGEFGPMTPLVWEEPKPGAAYINVLLGDTSVTAIPVRDAARLRDDQKEILEFIEKKMTGRRRLGAAEEPVLGLTEDLKRQAIRAVEAELPAPAEAAPVTEAVGDAFRQAEAGQRARYDRAVQLAESYRKQGDLAQARKLYDDALREAPDGREAQEGLRRLEELGKIAGAKEGQPAAPPETQEAAYDVSSALTLADKLGKEGGVGWDEAVARDVGGSTIVDLVTGKQQSTQTEGGAVVALEGGTLKITGTSDEVERVKREAASVRERMLAMVREISQRRQTEEAEQEARQRAELRRRQAAAALRTPAGAGTISGNRAAGALPLELTFPTFGTLAYPFRMDYAGTSQARIELVCVRAGAAMVLQGALVLALLVAVGGAAWRWPRVAAALGVALALLLGFALATGGEASKPYVVTALVGLCLAAPLVLGRLLLRRARIVTGG